MRVTADSLLRVKAYVFAAVVLLILVLYFFSAR